VDKQRRLERDVEAFAARRTGRESVFMPSGRIALYCALRALLSPGDRILMSPVNDDVIFFVVLAAGLRPVAAPLSATDGNIDVEAIPSQTWTEIRAVLTTNLYGLPDRMAALRRRCDAHGLALIEDVAHAIETDVDGTPLGAFGEAAAFSLSKHVDAYRGGVLAVADPHLRGEIERVRAGILAEPTIGRRIADLAKPPAKALLEAAGIMGRVRRARAAAAERYVERPGGSHRMDLRPDALRRAIAAGPVLAAFDPWVRVDRHDYPVRPSIADLNRILERLRGLDADRERRIHGVERLRRELDCVTPGARGASPLPLFRVPLLVADREAAMAMLAARGVWVRYVYDPPLDDYAGPEFIAPSPAPAAGRWWVRHALPIDPLVADAALPVLRGLRAAPRYPAAP
jgi:selenocysteine lyase/cysteine desulfurase